MNAVDRLKRDHGILRSKLDVLETALGMGPQTWYVLREVSFTLAKQLRDHIRREEELVALCRKAMNPKVLAEVSVEHHDEPEHLRTLNRLFVKEPTHALDRIKPVLTDVIQGLRHHMAEEERDLFPILERTLEEAMPSKPEVTTVPIEETMTVNRIVRDFPHTQRVFEQLFINVPMEGCTCLDEVAWRHGLEARELVHLLEAAIDSCACGTRSSTETQQPAAVGCGSQESG